MEARVIKTESKKIVYEVILPKGTTGAKAYELFRYQIGNGAVLTEAVKLVFVIGD